MKLGGTLLYFLSHSSLIHMPTLCGPCPLIIYCHYSHLCLCLYLMLGRLLINWPSPHHISVTLLPLPILPSHVPVTPSDVVLCCHAPSHVVPCYCTGWYRTTLLLPTMPSCVLQAPSSVFLCCHPSQWCLLCYSCISTSSLFSMSLLSSSLSLNL